MSTFTSWYTRYRGSWCVQYFHHAHLQVHRPAWLTTNCHSTVGTPSVTPQRSDDDDPKPHLVIPGMMPESFPALATSPDARLIVIRDETVFIYIMRGRLVNHFIEVGTDSRVSRRK
jgi:hypothetical protein